MGDAPAERSVYCLMCRAFTIFTSDDVKEREVRDADVFSAPQIVDYIVCPKCKEEITLGLPRFRSQPGPPGSI